MNVPSVNVQDNVKCKVLRIINNQNNHKKNDFIIEKETNSKSYSSNHGDNSIDTKVTFPDYRNDHLCKQLYKHIIRFIKENDIKNNKDTLNIKTMLIDIENVFKKYGFCSCCATNLS
jgi:ABC-type ATPase with predicted acetyltransferase domain